MEVNRLIFHEEKGDIPIWNIYLFTEGLILFNVEKVEEVMIDGMMGGTDILEAVGKNGELIDVSILCKLDSFSFLGKKINVETDISPGSVAEKKLTEFYSLVPGFGGRETIQG